MKPKYNVRLKMKDGEWFAINNVYRIDKQILGNKIIFRLTNSMSSNEVVEVDMNEIAIKEVTEIDGGIGGWCW